MDVSNNINLLLSQYNKATNLQKITKGLIDICQKKQINTINSFVDGISIDTAQKWLLSRIGDNHGFKRPVEFEDDRYLFFGLNEWGTNYNQEPYFYGEFAPIIPIDDQLYKKLLKFWLLSLVHDGSTFNLNNILKNTFGINCYAVDNNDLEIQIYIDDSYTKQQKQAISSVIPKNSGISYTLSN